MGLTRQGVQRTINELAKTGVVEVNRNLDHKRAPLVSLSAAGVEALEGIDQVQFAWVNEMAAGLTDRQIIEALQLLTSVRRRCEQTPIEPTKENDDA